MLESRFSDEMVRRMNAVIEERILRNPVVMPSGRMILEGRRIWQQIRRRVSTCPVCGSGIQLLSYKIGPCPECQGEKVA